jgi:hypothetical protein
MSTVSPPRGHHAGLFHRHRGNSYHSTRSPSPPPDFQTPVNVPIFQGTDAVAQNHKVVLQRVIEVHNALELQHQRRTTSTTSSSSGERPTSSSSSVSSDPSALDLTDIPFPDAEVRAFRYFLRLWDPANTPSDPDFEVAIQSQKRQFEETAIKHFFRRIAAWGESPEVRESMSRSFFRRRRSRARSVVGKLGMMMKQGSVNGVDGDVSDGLKEVTTKEGLAQLLWTLVQDPEKPLGGKLTERFDDALKEMYRMTNSGTGTGTGTAQ